MEVKAISKYERISPIKAKPVCDIVRGKSVVQARAILRFSNRKAGRILLKVLNSAVANAEHNNDLQAENLVIKEVYAHQGPLMRRWKAGSKGRANPFVHRTSHIGVVLSESGKEA